VVRWVINKSCVINRPVNDEATRRQTIVLTQNAAMMFAVNVDDRSTDATEQWRHTAAVLLLLIAGMSSSSLRSASSRSPTNYSVIYRNVRHFTKFWGAVGCWWGVFLWKDWTKYPPDIFFLIAGLSVWNCLYYLQLQSKVILFLT